MKKRLRKKLHLREFTEYGVQADIKVLSDLTEEKFDRLIWEGFVEEFVEGNDLYCGGAWSSSNKTGDFFIETGMEFRKAEAIAGKLKEWFEAKGLRHELKTEIRNAWYS